MNRKAKDALIGLAFGLIVGPALVLLLDRPPSTQPAVKASSSGGGAVDESRARAAWESAKRFAQEQASRRAAAEARDREQQLRRYLSDPGLTVARMMEDDGHKFTFEAKHYMAVAARAAEKAAQAGK